MSIPKWNVDLTQAKQQNLRITRTNEGTITVDDLKIAQFIHTILNNENVRNVIDTLTTNLVLILGRFTPDGRSQFWYGLILGEKSRLPTNIQSCLPTEPCKLT
jgi:hypothetical protein